jgi:hypothetical protein
MRSFLLAFVLNAFVVMSVPVFAQMGAYGQFGIGMYGGMQACPYGGGGVPQGLTDIQDEIDELQKEIRDLRSKIRTNKAKIKSTEDMIKSTETLLCMHLTDNACSGVKSHIGDPKLPNDMQTGGLRRWSPENVCQNNSNVPVASRPWPGFCENQNNETNFWQNVIHPTESSRVLKQICKQTEYIRAGRYLDEFVNNCEKSLDRLHDLHFERRGIEDPKYLEEQLKYKQAELKLKREEGKALRREIQEEITESGTCIECSPRFTNPPISKAERWGSLALGALGAYLGYKGGKYAVDQAANLGWPTSPYAVQAGIFPFAMAGIYGATYGGGAYNCFGQYPMGGMMGPGGAYGMGMYPNIGGPFQYPPGWGYPGGAGGGIFMPGMGPWGMNGYPGMFPGMVMPGMMVGGIGIGGMMMPMPFMGGGAMMGMPWMGMPAGGMMMGMPAMGMVAGGIGIGGMVMPFPAGGMVMPFPAGGMMVGGIGIGGMMMPFPAGGMMMGMPVGGMYPAGGMMMGMPAAGGMMVGWQYQQQMMQMQMQQMQMWQQQQMAMQQDYMNRQQLVGRLSQELIRIQMQIQQISMGSYFGGTIGGGMSVPTGTLIDPVTGQVISNSGFGYGDPNLGPVPAR